MADIDQTTVRKIARLANLNLSDPETERLAGQLAHILDYVRKLGELDTRNVPETAHALPLINVWRPDDPRPCLPRDEVLAAAPDAVEGCFRVPRIID